MRKRKSFYNNLIFGSLRKETLDVFRNRLDFGDRTSVSLTHGKLFLLVSLTCLTRYKNRKRQSSFFLVSHTHTKSH